MAQPRSHTGAMAQLDRTQRRGGSLKNPPIPTFEQLLQGGEATRWSPHNSSHSPTFGRNHDMEDDHAPQKKSVLAKVKEKARKWRQSLATKKHNEDANPSQGVSVYDEDEDPEYLGAPMYESEMAPEGFKEHARQHPRAAPVISEKHVLASSVNNAPDQRSPYARSPRAEQPMAESWPEKQEKERSPRKLLENVTRNPEFATASNATQSLYASTPQTTVRMASNHAAKFSAALERKQAPATGAPGQAAAATAPAALAAGDNSTTGEHIWDKGVSVKEYIMNKFEPGEDERALSRVISQAISPRKAPGDAGVVEKVKDAVASFLRTEEAPEPSIRDHTPNNLSSHIPISTNPREVVEEENHGRILQAN